MRLHWRLRLVSSVRSVIPVTERSFRKRSFAAMVEMENELCFVCVENWVAGKWKVLQLFNGSLSDFEAVAEF